MQTKTKQNKEIKTYPKTYSIWKSEFLEYADWHTGTNNIQVQILERCFKSPQIIILVYAW